MPCRRRMKSAIDLALEVRVRRSPHDTRDAYISEYQGERRDATPTGAACHDRGAFDRLSPAIRRSHNVSGRSMRRNERLHCCWLSCSGRTGCANMTPTQQRALSGGAIGARRWGGRGRDRGGLRSGPSWAGRLVTVGHSGRTSTRPSSEGRPVVHRAAHAERSHVRPAPPSRPAGGLGRASSLQCERYGSWSFSTS
jgi:hypothetical protein